MPPVVRELRLAAMTNPRPTVRTSFHVLMEKLVKMGAYLAASVIIARLAGPEIFGQYSSLLAVAVIFTALAAIGLNALLVREFFHTDDCRRVLSNVLVLRLQAAALAATIMVLATLVFLAVPIKAGVLASLLIPIALFQVADSLFESRLELDRVLKYKTVGYISGLIIKAITALVSPHLISLLLAHVAEMSIILLGAALSLRRAGIVPDSAVLNAAYRWELLKKGLPLLLSSGAVLLYMKVDLPMLLAMSGAAEAGIYSVATRLCEALFIISIPIIVAVFPKLLALHSENAALFDRYLMRVFLLLAGIGGLTYGATALFSEPVVDVLFGSDYSASASIIRIYALSLPIVFVGDLFSRWLIITNNLALSLYRHLFGLATNLSLNFLLIPVYGGAGAAYASVAGYAAAVIVFPLVSRRARHFYNFMRFR